MTEEVKEVVDYKKIVLVIIGILFAIAVFVYINPGNYIILPTIEIQEELPITEKTTQIKPEYEKFLDLGISYDDIIDFQDMDCTIFNTPERISQDSKFISIIEQKKLTVDCNEMSYQLNARQREEVYKKCEVIYPEICSHCQKTLKECGMDKFYLHHTRYDVDPKDIEYIRFMCKSCNKLELFSRKTIEEYCLRNPLGQRPYNPSPTAPRTFTKGEIIESRLRQYLPRRLVKKEKEWKKRESQEEKNYHMTNSKPMLLSIVDVYQTLLINMSFHFVHQQRENTNSLLILI